MKLSERLEALVRNACPGWHAAETIREAADLARSVEDAPAADIREDGKNGRESALLSAATRAGYYQGQRVRIVPEQGGSVTDHLKHAYDPGTDGIICAATLADAAADPALTLDIARELLREAAEAIRCLHQYRERKNP